MLILVLSFSLILFFCAPVTAQVEPVERNVYLMGTSLRMELHEKNREKGLRDLETLVRIVEEAEDQLSTWREWSELSKLNQQDVMKPLRAAPALCDLLKRLTLWVRLTNGAFDPGVGRLLELWRDPSDPPDVSEIGPALQHTGLLRLQIEDCLVRKNAPVLLDAGAFGKGEALDRVLAAAEENRMAPLYLNFGGQVIVRNHTVSISLAHPAMRSETSGVHISISSGSVATSGPSEKKGHIVDPRSGYPAEDFGSVTVWHSRALEADILSTALYVMGPSAGYEWAARHQIAACFLILENERLLIGMTPAWKSNPAGTKTRRK
jgi:thiamine biosynthesis lipoprotein